MSVRFSDSHCVHCVCNVVFLIRTLFLVIVYGFEKI